MKTKNTIRNCPSEFKFVCPILWENLITTDNDHIRRCEQCNKSVYYCETDEETIKHAIDGNCIARKTPIGSELPHITLGMPKNPIDITEQQKQASQLKHREKAIDDAILNIKNTSRICPNCKYPLKDWLKTCPVCNTKIDRA